MDGIRWLVAQPIYAISMKDSCLTKNKATIASVGDWRFTRYSVSVFLKDVICPCSTNEERWGIKPQVGSNTGGSGASSEFCHSLFNCLNGSAVRLRRKHFENRISYLTWSSSRKHRHNYCGHAHYDVWTSLSI
jgi:hypothetical protein